MILATTRVENVERFLSFMGIANTNVAKMVIDDINARGGVLGRPVELFIEHSATDHQVSEAAATKLVHWPWTR
jgi:ABC-type branched-subunit amino acid transport system substrate-binding protein